MRATQKFGEREHSLNFVGKSSKGKILRAVKNVNGPFITPQRDDYIDTNEKQKKTTSQSCGIRLFLAAICPSGPCMQELFSNIRSVKPRFTGPLNRTPRYCGLFALSLGKEIRYFSSKFNPLDTDTPIIQEHSVAPSVSILTRRVWLYLSCHNAWPQVNQCFRLFHGRGLPWSTY